MVEGVRGVATALDFGARPVRAYRADPPRKADEIEALASRLPCEALPVAREVLSWAVSVEGETDWVALFPFHPLRADACGLTPKRALVLEGVGDPGNVGSAIRSAAAAGVDCVVLAGSCADWTNPKTVRSSAGAVFALPIVESDSVGQALEALGLRGIGTDARAETTIHDLTPPERWGLVMGHEVRGLSDEAREACSGLVRIPMAPGIESLNVASAAAVCLFTLGRP